MFTALKWHSHTDVIVPILGGAWDGATILCKNLEPGRITRLNDERYVMVWLNGRPRLEIVK